MARGLFDPLRQRGPQKLRPTPRPPRAAERKVYSVSALTSAVKDKLEKAFGSLWVKGEVSNLAEPESGNVYFTLQDVEAQLNCVMFRATAARMKKFLAEGAELLAFGRLTVYGRRGQYQLIADRIEPVGLGALQLAFERLKEKLAREGLFDPARKKKLPLVPRTVAVVTSTTGAAVRDILRVLGRNFPRLCVVAVPTRVQGDGAAEEIASALKLADDWGGADVIIVGRGGGSAEDLWAFNEEIVARAIFRCRTPVVSAVGHEVDVTIADYVADVRALTPSEAAERAAPRLDELLARLEELRDFLSGELRRIFARARERLEGFSERLSPARARERPGMLAQRLDELSGRLSASAERTVEFARERTKAASGRLEALSPLRVLERGYSLTFREGETTPLKDAKDARPGEALVTRLAKGTLKSRVRGN